MSRRNCNRLPAARTLKPAIQISPLIDSALVCPRASLRGAVATAQMAEDMRQGGHREGGVTEHDLKLLGWSREQICDLADAANIRAQSLAGATA